MTTMLTYSFVNANNECLYEYLYKCIKNDIISGVLAVHTKLPSKRSFAKNLGVSTITVENAYAQLAAEGYIFSIPKKGYYVSHLSMQMKDLAEFSTVPKKISLPAKKQAYFADFKSNETRPDQFPFATWTKLMREVMAESADLLMTNSPCCGILELREAIAAHLKQFHAIHISPDQIVVGAGTEILYGLLIQLLGREKTFAVEEPGYQKITKVYESNQVACVHVPLDEQGPEMSVLTQSGADILHISPSHHYPTGQVIPISRRYELLGWASAKEGRYIIEDDYDSEFRFMGKPIPTLLSIDTMGHTIYMNTFSKSLASTIRISYMVLPPVLMQKFYDTLSFYSCTVSNFEQYTLARFIQGGYFEKHINRMRNYYRTQRDQLLFCIKKSPLSSRVTIAEEDSGLHFLLKLATDLDDQEIISRAAKRGLRLTFLAEYYHQPDAAAAHTLVINYSSIPPEKMEKAVELILECL